MLLNLSDVEMTSLDWPAALAVLQASLALREPTDLAGIAIVLPALGHVYFELGCPAEALAHLDRAIPLCQRVGNEVDGWYGRLARATLHLSAGAVRPALCDAVQAWRLCSPARAYETASTMRLLGHVTARAGRPLASSTLHHRADDYFRAYDGRANPAVESLLGHAERAASG
jgi:tetratricopeptide (TPR) repeat protein